MSARSQKPPAGRPAVDLDVLVQNLPGNVVRRVRHADGRYSYSYLSQGLKDIFGIDPNAITEQRDVDFSWIPESDRTAFLQALEDSAERLTTLDLENRVISADGEMRWVRSIGKPRRLADGTVIWDGLALDVTDKHAAEEALRAALLRAEEADAAKSKFLAAASHDLRQPLQAMRFYLSLLSRDAERLPEQLGRLEACLDSMETLLSALLDISKLDAGVVIVRPAPLELRALIESLIEETAPNAGVAIEVEGPLYPCFGDPTLLASVLRNLLDNAVKYGAGKPVTLRIRAGRTGVRILVVDRGLGIAAEQRQAIFEPFVQLGNAARDRSLGLGLGLAIADRITRLLGGRLRLRSSPGQGSVFALSLPWPRQEGIDLRPKLANNTEGGSLAGQRVWVLEDDTEVAASLMALLELWGLNARLATTVGELDRLARDSEAADAIIADYRLASRRTGAEAIADARRLAARDVPAVLLTGESDPGHLDQAALGGYRLLHKPVKAARLKALLAHLFKGKAA